MTAAYAGLPRPYARAVGCGPGVVCLHANASTSGQWRALMERLAARHQVLAPDLYGAGRSPEWTQGRDLMLADEAAFIEPVLDAAGPAPVTLIGHSYGAAVALKTALLHPQRIGALALYEPTLFALIDAAGPPPNDADGIRHTVQRAGALLDAGLENEAAECFIDYWMWPGAWRAMPEERKPLLAAAVRNVRRWGATLFNEPAPLAEWSRLDIPVLYMMGRRSTASARGVARLLTPVLPRVEVLEFESLGHMGPVTHADEVNRAIDLFLTKVAPG